MNCTSDTMRCTFSERTLYRQTNQDVIRKVFWYSQASKGKLVTQKLVSDNLGSVLAATTLHAKEINHGNLL